MVTANDVQNVLERVFGIHVAVKDFHVGNGSCSLQTERNELQKQVSKGSRSFHVRVSAFSYNTISDFQRLHNVLYNNISLTDHIKRSKFGLFKWNIKMDEALQPRLSKLPYLRCLSVLSCFHDHLSWKLKLRFDGSWMMWRA